MVENFIKTTLRGFRRHKSSFFINLIGLSIGLACSFLILIWVLDEMGMDRYHQDIDQIYQIMKHQTYENEISTVDNTPGILAQTLKNEFPEFQYAANYTWINEYLFVNDNVSFRELGLYVENDFFKILSIDLISGTHDNLLTSPNTIVLSEYMAKKYFGNINPIGKTIYFENNRDLTVTGVFKNMPDNSTFQFDCLLNYEDWLERNEWAQNWWNSGPRTITKLSPGVNAKDLGRKFNGYVNAKNENTSNVELFLYPFANRYLYGNWEHKVSAGGRIEYVRLFIIVAIFILLIACINFMNLSTAKATKRAKEVGIRKSMGASKASLIGQFIGESLIISFVALFISIALVELLLPGFNNLTGKSITVNYGDSFLLGLFISTILVTGLISGSYPAFYLSSLEATKTLKGALKSSWKEALARKGLVVFQFSLSILLIASTIIIYQQIQFVQDKNLGYNKSNLISFITQDQIAQQWETVHDQIQKISGVTSVSRASHPFVQQNNNTINLEWEGKKPDANILFEEIGVDHGLLETMGIKIIAGRDFSPMLESDSSKIILNETAIKVMGLENPIGKTIELYGREQEIIGIAKDFHFQSFRSEISPVFFRLVHWSWKAYVRIEPENISNTLTQIEKIYKTFNTNYPFDYSFMDEQYASLYQSEMRVGVLAKYFSIIAIFISCLGLFGLSAFTAEQRSKEIGVRKVLGASVHGLVVLFSKDFTKLVLIAFAIATPISWYLMRKWISDYAYSSGIEWWVFIIAGVTTLIIAWLTISWQSIKAALTNPVDSLKTE